MTMQPIDEILTEIADRHRHPAEVEPLHARARAAIERLGLDGSRLELAVAVFGWGSDEANGSLVSLIREESDILAVTLRFFLRGGWTVCTGDLTNVLAQHRDRDHALVLALESL